jgi:hypothetical protein
MPQIKENKTNADHSKVKRPEAKLMFTDRKFNRLLVTKKPMLKRCKLSEE